MKFGMFIDLQLPRPWTDRAEMTLLRDAVRQGVLGEQVGIECAWAQEHHFLEEYSHSSAPEVLLGALSQATTTMRLGHGVTLMPPSFNHPARIAERVATLDVLSGGRVEWGTGESSSRIELEGFGVDMLSKRAMWAEAVAEVAKMMQATPYAGHDGRFFSMPARNVVPKPVQRPHPPIWVACSSRETLRMAARLGIGALTFAFMDAREAKFWVDEYYDEFEHHCTPIGRAVNPNVAVLSGFMLHSDGAEAERRGRAGLQFFAYGLSHYYRHGTHIPGQTDLWRSFSEATSTPLAGVGGIGAPADVGAYFSELEDAGVDQVILLQQTGMTANEHIIEALELFGAEVIGDFPGRDAARTERKRALLAAAVARAEAAIAPLPQVEAEPVESYPVLLERRGLDEAAVGTHRALASASLWRMAVGGSEGGRGRDGGAA